MTQQQQPSKALNIALWVVQVLLCTTLLWAASMKLFQPIAKLSAMWPWAGQVPDKLVKLTGVVDFLGGVGLVLPMLLNIKPRLTLFAAWGIIVLMILASAFHISRGESGLIMPNIIFVIMAAFIVWGRKGRHN